MCDLLCADCRRKIFKNSDDIIDYFNNIKEEIDNNTRKKVYIDNIDLNNIEEILNNYINNNYNKYDYYFVKVTFNISFDEDDNIDLFTTYEHNNEIYKIIIQLQYFIDIMKLKGKIFNKKNQITIYFLEDKCNITDDYSKYMRYSCIERKINQLPDKYQLLNQVSNNILIKNKSHIIFNI